MVYFNALYLIVYNISKKMSNGLPIFNYCIRSAIEQNQPNVRNGVLYPINKKLLITFFIIFINDSIQYKIGIQNGIEWHIFLYKDDTAESMVLLNMHNNGSIRINTSDVVYLGVTETTEDAMVRLFRHSLDNKINTTTATRITSAMKLALVTRTKSSATRTTSSETSTTSSETSTTSLDTSTTSLDMDEIIFEDEEMDFEEDEMDFADDEMDFSDAEIRLTDEMNDQFWDDRFPISVNQVFDVSSDLMESLDSLYWFPYEGHPISWHSEYQEELETIISYAQNLLNSENM